MTLIKFPRTRHLEGSRLQADDLADDKSLIDLRGQTLCVAEKLDGANCAVSFSANGALRLQSRGHYLTGSPRERHFDLLKTWAATHAYRLREALGHRYIMYGEWLYAKHTLFYDRLPHYFLEFDVLDRETGLFLDVEGRKVLLNGLPVMRAPIIHRGEIRSPSELEQLVRPSLFRSKNWRAALKEAAEASKSRLDKVAEQTEQTDLAEGLYVKREADGMVAERYKFVRGGFQQAIAASQGHWQDRPVLPNGLAEGVDIFAQALAVEGSYDDPSSS
ncbi:MAG: RNA ligase family protein [Pseudomonadota bacterium]